MKRLLAVLGGALGLGALVRRQRGRGGSGAIESPAEELRAKLAQSRAVVNEREVDEAGETPVDAVEDATPAVPVDPVPVDARRRAVHERARKAADDLA